MNRDVWWCLQSRVPMTYEDEVALNEDVALF